MKRRTFLQAILACLIPIPCVRGSDKKRDPGPKWPVKKPPELPTFDVGKSVDLMLNYCKDARWDIVARAMKTLEEEFQKKVNNDVWFELFDYQKPVVKRIFDGNRRIGIAPEDQDKFTPLLVSQELGAAVLDNKRILLGSL